MVLGYAYQLPFGKAGTFTATLGTTYAHNFYLWWLAKAGAVGMASFAVFALTPVVRGIRSASAEAKISAAVSARPARGVCGGPAAVGAGELAGAGHGAGRRDGIRPAAAARGAGRAKRLHSRPSCSYQQSTPKPLRNVIGSIGSRTGRSSMAWAHHRLCRQPTASVRAPAATSVRMLCSRSAACSTA